MARLACEVCGLSPARRYVLRYRNRVRILCDVHEARRQSKRAGRLVAEARCSLGSLAAAARWRKAQLTPAQATLHGYRLAQARWAQSSRTKGGETHGRDSNKRADSVAA
jgi:hypothetical protein